MDCSTAKCYSCDRDLDPCPQNYICHALTNLAIPPPPSGEGEGVLELDGEGGHGVCVWRGGYICVYLATCVCVVVTTLHAHLV